MSRNWFFQSSARFNAADRSRKSRQHLRIESLEGRNLLTTLSVDIGDIGCATEGDHNYCQIQDAIDVAEESDVIEVANGTYDKIQILTDNLTLRAADGATPTINARGAQTAISLPADGITIQGFAVENAFVGFDVTGSSNTIASNHVRHIQLDPSSASSRAFRVTGGGFNMFSDNTAEGNGFLLENTESNTLVNNHVSTAAYSAFFVRDSDRNIFHHNTAVDSTNNGFYLNQNNHFNVLTENIAENGTGGIAVHSSSNNTIEHNTVRGNRWGIAIAMNKWWDSTVAPESNMFVGNTAEGNLEAGFALAEAHSNMFRGNVANNNPGDGFVIYHSVSSRQFDDSQSNTFQDNTAVGNGGFGFSLPAEHDPLANMFEDNRCVENANGAASEGFVACSLPTAGDANLDGKVDALDLNEIGLNWRQNVTGWRSGDFNADGRVDASDLNALALNWRQDVSGEAAAARAPRAALANRVSVPVAPAQDTHGFIATSEPQSSRGDMTVVSGSDYGLSSHLTKRYVRREPMASTRINSRAGDIQQSQKMNAEQLVNETLRSVAKDQWLRQQSW